MISLRSATLLSLALSVLPALQLEADIRMQALFCDHLMLQAEKPAAVWGWAEPGTRIQVTFTNAAGQVTARSKAVTAEDDRWSLMLPTLPTNLSGSLRISSDRGDSLILHDVLVGEVWLGSGQSNMGYAINATNAPPEIWAAARSQARAAGGQIRYFAVVSPGASVPQADVKGHWVLVGPDEVGPCSAVAWDFAVELRRRLHRPVGMIVSAVGGTPAEAWIPQSALDATSVGAAIERRNAEALAVTPPDALSRYAQELAQWRKTYPTAQLQAKHRAPAEPYSPGFRMVPCRLYNGKIHGLEPYTFKGILWFQADGNERHPEEYGELIQTLIRTWRDRWHDRLPFYYVEENNIHAYQTEPAEKTGLAFVRDAENAALALPDVDVATSVDLGLGSDAHFPNKWEVGKRLVGLAMNNLYGETGPVHSPQFEKVQFEGHRVRLEFKYAEGLRTRHSQPLRGFALRGATGEWAWAQGEIHQEEIVIWSDQVARPAAVRYAWGSNPVLSVENAAGLPLRPFRTDADAIIPYPQPDWLPVAASEFNVRNYGAKANGTANDRSAIQHAIDAAARSGPGAVVLIPRGRYRLTPEGRSSVHLDISQVRGLTIRGEPGAILDCTEPNAHVFRISGSAGIRIESIRLERHPFLFTQGVIGAISAANRTVEIAIDPGYDEPDAKYLAKMDFLMVFSDPGALSWHHDAPWPPQIERRERISPGHWRLTLSRSPLPAYSGAPFAIWKNLYSGWAFAMADSRDVAIEDVAYYADGGQAGFVVNHCEGEISFHRFAVVPQPGSNQRFASAGGAMVFNNRIRLLVDDCDFAATDDDGINMGTNSSHILAQVGPRTLEIESGRDRGDYRAGDQVALWDWVAKKERMEARVVGVTSGRSALKVELDRDVGISRTGVGPWKEFINGRPAGDNSEADREAKHAARRANETDGIDRLIDLDDAGTAIIRNSRFQSYRARNILMKAPNALIENNVFHDTVMASILVGPEFYWDEGPAVRHLVIRNNRFVNVSGSSIVLGAHFSDQSYDNRDITIEGNTFVGYGHYGINVAGKQGAPIFIRNSDGVMIKNNEIGLPDPDAPSVPRIEIEVSKSVQQSGNRIASPSPAI